ncbi:MAG: hypothetical protein U0793_34520 [Gemmataceae bacterium]
MFQRSAIVLLTMIGLAVEAGSAGAQLGPAIGPPPGGAPSTHSSFPRLTIPAPPPGWLGAHPAPAPHPAPAQHNVYTIYFRESPSLPWRVYTRFNRESDALWAVRSLRANHYEAYYR